MRTRRPRASFKLLLGSLLFFWLLLGSITYAFYPRLTGHRVLDALLVSAMVTLLLATFAEPLVGLLAAARHLFRRGDEAAQNSPDP